MITFIPLTGFLGAGKTTTMTATALALQAAGHKVAVITNDQGVELVDTKLARSQLDSVAEVTGGCFCCRFEDLVEAVVGLVDSDAVDTVIAEAVGSCTDLQATVVRPLRRYYGDSMVVTPLTTVLDPFRYQAFSRAAERGEPESDLSYLFRQQLIEADVIALNKLDLLPADKATTMLGKLRQDYPNAVVVGYSATQGEGVSSLLNAWEGPSTNEDVILDVDYDRYAAAEAQLAWMNQELQVSASGESLDPTAWAHQVLTHLSQWSAQQGAVIGHAKLTVELPDGDFVKLSLTEAGAEPTTDRTAAATSDEVRAVVNARVAVEPDQLDTAVTAAVAAADLATGATSSATSPVSFKPGYPTPVHRLAAAGA
ncbi:CobW-like GTP-binding protein [Kineosporia babensis]|uniref:CobW-like GTP-binding protein n=1 Tax=Kineosporia babensis TaxID=499548 RepID=A0A9X1NNW7_9ACTN|nr:CobW-like GTP-binding protein [Kineosporia babensis]MCD5317206.1 CobW-like GTP-binding protein [Kineosporia babensis]